MDRTYYYDVNGVCYFRSFDSWFVKLKKMDVPLSYQASEHLNECVENGKLKTKNPKAKKKIG